MWTYQEKQQLYPGDTTGSHPERLNGLTDDNAADCAAILPPVTPCTKTELTQGIFSGYRFYDQQHLAPQYPFGYGLSYTDFRYSSLQRKKSAGGVDATFRVSNTGRTTGATVAQVYVGPGKPVTGVQQAVRSLRGFQRITLLPGQSQTVTIHLDARSFQYWNEKQQNWTTIDGPRTISVGDADAADHLPLRAWTYIR